MPKKIKSWEELVGLESENHKLEVELIGRGGGCAWIVPKVETEQTRKDYFKHHWYLSTHTFYPSTVKDSTAKLQEFGFDVELIDDTKS